MRAILALVFLMLFATEASACPAFCKFWSFASWGTGLIPAKVLFVAAGFSVTPVGIVSAAISATCFLEKHPGKPVTKAQFDEWNKTMKASGL